MSSSGLAIVQTEQKEREDQTADLNEHWIVAKETLGDKAPGNVDRILKAQALGDPSMTSYVVLKKTTELNPRNPLIKELERKCKADQRVRNSTYLLSKTALLIFGSNIDERTLFAERMRLGSMWTRYRWRRSTKRFADSVWNGLRRRPED
ncbi:hypothetical protein K525DRAFT_275026 [Schizophyllum commune Loenen D]|nr:hypothetical protein K525DRAFT_275026 [Schizophyllum commune Loenen D]